MFKFSQFFNGGDSLPHARLQHFIEIWSEFTPTNTMATLTSKWSTFYVQNSLQNSLHSIRMYGVKT